MRVIATISLRKAVHSAVGAGCKPGHFRAPYFIKSMGACAFDPDTLSFAGRIGFREIFCSAPINGAQPLEWAKRLARTELAVEQFGDGSVNDINSPGKYTLKDGIAETGRLVVLQMPPG